MILSALLKDILLQRPCLHLLFSYSEIKLTQDRRDKCLVLLSINFQSKFMPLLVFCGCCNTLPHKLGSLKQTKSLFPHSSASLKSEISFTEPKPKCLQGHTSSSTSKVESILCLFQIWWLPICFGLWLHHCITKANISRFSYSASIIWPLTGCVWFSEGLPWPLSYTFVIAFWDHPDKPGKSPHLQNLNLIIFTKTLFPNELFPGSRDQDLIFSEAIIQPIVLLQ